MRMGGTWRESGSSKARCERAGTDLERNEHVERSSHSKLGAAAAMVHEKMTRGAEGAQVETRGKSN
jgi:hypothetical protein